MSVPNSMRDLSERPWLAAALAPLVTPLGFVVMAPLNHTRSSTGGLDTLLPILLVIYFVAYAYMWVIALPIILLSRRWVRWQWPALVVLGAVLGALPWLLAGLRSPAGPSQFLREILRGERQWLLFGACGAAVAAAFCVLQSRFLRRSREPGSSR